jgi:hypothetical protein
MFLPCFIKYPLLMKSRIYCKKESQHPVDVARWSGLSSYFKVKRVSFPTILVETDSFLLEPFLCVFHKCRMLFSVHFYCFFATISDIYAATFCICSSDNRSANAGIVVPPVLTLSITFFASSAVWLSCKSGPLCPPVPSFP